LQSKPISVSLAPASTPVMSPANSTSTGKQRKGKCHEPFLEGQIRRKEGLGLSLCIEPLTQVHASISE
jgi:hypothetical protein